MAEALRIAIVGAESTGKSVLSQALVARLGADTGLRCSLVPEYLREWCNREGRTPRPDEQRGIARAQQARIDEAAARHDLVVCDATALMVAVYSRLLFQDESLVPEVMAWHRTMDATLLTALDIPWHSDPLRDGPHVREPVDGLVRQLLIEHGIAFSLVSGQGEARLASALDALTPLLADRATPRRGLFTRLQAREAAQPEWRWACDQCDAPECEHQALAARRAGSLQGR